MREFLGWRLVLEDAEMAREVEKEEAEAEGVPSGPFFSGEARADRRARIARIRGYRLHA